MFVALVQAVYRAAVETSANLLVGAPSNPPLLLMLDEAGKIAPLQTLSKIAATGAGQGITLMTIWHDRAQIRDLYRESERTLICNHTITVWLPGSQNLDTLKLLSDLIGDQPVASATVSAAPDGGLSVSEGSERLDVAPPAFLRTLRHGAAVMLTGNTPPALIATHAYYEQHRWRRHTDRDQLARHADMHNGAGPTTAASWDERGWSDHLPEPQTERREATRERERGPQPGRGALASALVADYPPVLCNRDRRRAFGPGGNAIPDQLRGDPGHWSTITLPADVADTLDATHADLSDPRIRRRVLPHLLDSGRFGFPRDHGVTVASLIQSGWPA